MRQLDECEMQILPRRGIEDRTCPGRAFFSIRAAHRPHNNVQFRLDRAMKNSEAASRRCNSIAAARQASSMPREFSLGNQRQQALRRPKRHGCRPGARTLQADLPKMQFVRGEISIGRIVFVEASHGRIAKQHAAAAVGLQPVLVRIDDDGIHLAISAAYAARLRRLKC